MKNTVLKLLAFLLVLSMLFTAGLSSAVMAEEANPVEESGSGETAGDDTAGDDTTGDDTTGDDTTGDDTTGDDTTGDDTTGDDTTGDDTTGDDTTGDDTTGDDTTGDNTAGDNTTDEPADEPEDEGSDEADAITYEGEVGEEIDFSDSDFVNAYKNATGKNFRHFEITKLPSSTYGTLYYDYKGNDQEKIVAKEAIKKTYIDDISFVAKKECELTIAIVLCGTESGDPEIEGEIKIIVEDEAKSASAISLSVYNDDEVSFSGSKFNSVCKTATGKNLDYVKFTLPSSSAGVLYYDYDGTDEEKITKSTKIYYDDDPDLDDITFVPKSSYSGTVTIKYTGYNISDKEFSGTVKIKVSDADDDEDDEDYDVDTVSYTVYNDDELYFDGEDFYDVFDDAGEDFIGLEFKTVPTSSQGALYYDYDGADEEKIAKGDEFYYDDDPDISDIAFIPKSSYSGTVSLTYKGYYTSSKYIEGKITIKVKDADGDDDEDEDDEDYDVDTVSYTVSNDDELYFDGDDFYDVFDDAGEDFIGLEFKTVPSSSAGALYYDYDGADEEKIAKGDEFYYDDDPDISDIAFIPKSSYSGTVSLTYKGYYTSSKYIEGKITIKVKDADGDDDEDEDDGIKTINVKASSDQAVDMNASNINSAFKAATGYALSYIKFTLPSSSSGKLYYDYDGDDEEAVSASDKYYYSGSSNDLIKNVSFVPKKGYSGTVTINYSAYKSSSNTAYPGVIKITYSGSSSTGDEDTAIIYKDVTDAGVKFNVNDFNTASIVAVDSACAYVRLGLVSGGAGSLYLNYGKENQTLLSAGQTFYSDKMPNISDITFIPTAGFKGTASISYTGMSNDGDSFTGYIKIQVIEKPVEPENVVETIPEKKFTDVPEDSWYKDIVYKVCAAGLMKGSGDTTFNPEGNMTLAEAVTMAARVHNQGKGGKDSDFVASGANWYDVYVSYAISNGIMKEGDFNDYGRVATRAEMAYIFFHSVTPESLEAINSWIIPDVDKAGIYGVEIYALYDAGILAGNDAAGTFNPGSNIKRAEAATILARLGKIIDRVKK